MIPYATIAPIVIFPVAMLIITERLEGIEETGYSLT
jgi:hypothetical protein